VIPRASNRRPYDLVKRATDVAGALVLLVLSAPVQLVVALLVRIKLGSPVLFLQERPGRDGEIFTLRKFRTMLTVDESRGIVTDEQRLTQFGRTLRATSLDELPALVNVVRGDMSIIGPRPLLVSYLERYSATQARRHEVRPGITGLAQVNGRNDVDWARKLDLDVQYVDRRSFRLDASILLRTVAVVVSRKGVSAEGHASAPEFTGTSDRDLP